MLRVADQVAVLWGSEGGIFQDFSAPCGFCSALALCVLWGPLHSSLPGLEDNTWSSETASFIFQLTKSRFLFLQLASLLFHPVSPLSTQSRE